MDNKILKIEMTILKTSNIKDFCIDYQFSPTKRETSEVLKVVLDLKNDKLILPEFHFETETPPCINYMQYP